LWSDSESRTSPRSEYAGGAIESLNKNAVDTTTTRLTLACRMALVRATEKSRRRSQKGRTVLAAPGLESLRLAFGQALDQVGLNGTPTAASDLPELSQTIDHKRR
jgi:hypothetical protein